MPELEEVQHNTPESRAEGTQSGPVGWEAIPRDAEFDFEVNGTKVSVKGSKLKDMTQLGYSFVQRKRELEEEHAAKVREVEEIGSSYKKFDDYLRKNPDHRKLHAALARGDYASVEAFLAAKRGGATRQPAPGFQAGAGDGDDNNDYYLSQIHGVRQEVLGAIQQQNERLEGLLGELGGSVKHLTQSAQEAREIQFLKTNQKYARVATDERIELAKDHQRKYGGDLISAFRNVTWEDLPGVIEEDVVNRYGIDREAFGSPGASPPVVDGMRLDDSTLARLFEDPDELAKHADAIRRHRQRSQGKIPVPGRRSRGR